MYLFSTNNHLLMFSAVNYGRIVLKTLMTSLKKFLLFEILDTQSYMHLVTEDFIFKWINTDDYLFFTHEQSCFTDPLVIWNLKEKCIINFLYIYIYLYIIYIYNYIYI